MEKKDREKLLTFLETMEENGKLKNESIKNKKEFWKIFEEIMEITRNEKNEVLTDLLLKLESKNVEFFISLKQDYFNYGVLGHKAHEE